MVQRLETARYKGPSYPKPWNLWNLCQGRGSLYEIWGASAEKATGPKTGHHGEVGLQLRSGEVDYVCTV